MSLAFGLLFGVHYFILEPSNFASFSDTLRYFISALSTLLAVVVSFNTLALRNQLSNMPTNMERLNRQLDKIADLLQPVLNRKQMGKSHNDYNPALYYPDAMETMMIITKNQAEAILDNISESDDNRSRLQVYREIINQIDNRIAAYTKHKSPFFLVSISTTAFVEKMRFASLNLGNEKSEQEEMLFETAKRLQVIRNIGARIFIRNLLTKLSIDMLIYTIPIVIFAAIISAISNYGSYDDVSLRILFAVSMAAVALPFILLFIRAMPVLHLIAGSSSIPFAKED